MVALVFQWSASPVPVGRNTKTVWDSFVNTLHEEKEWQAVYLYSIQHRLDDAGHCDYAFFVVQVDAVQHHLVCPADEIAQTLVDAAVTRRQRRAADDDEG